MPQAVEAVAGWKRPRVCLREASSGKMGD